MLEKRYKELHIPGIAIAIVKEDQVIYKKGFGLRDVEKRLPVTPDTHFAIGSSSKAFTGMSVMMSVDDKKVSLEDAPRKYLPYFQMRDSEIDSRITVRDLLSHRSGLPRTDMIWYTGVLNSQEAIRAACSAVPTAKLGEKFQYQNVMFLAAGEIVAKAQKMRWQEFVRKRIFLPLGMKQSNFSPKEMYSLPDYALGYDYDTVAKAPKHLKMRDASNVAPAGAINSNVNEMSQWIRLMLNRGVFNGKRLVSESSFEELVKPQMAMSPKVGYGLGWMLREWNGHKIAEHGGNIDGFNAHVALMPDQKLGFVLLTNVSASSLGAETMTSVWENLVGGGEKPKEEVKPNSVASNVKPEEEAGNYRLVEANVDFKIEFKQGKLVLSVPGQPPYPLEPLGGRRYKLGSPAPTGFFITFRAKKDSPSIAEAYLEQPQGNAVLEKQDGKPLFKSPLTADQVIAKLLEALGGESNLRKVKTLTIVSETEAENQGMSSRSVQQFQAPNLNSEYVEFRALGKKIGWTREYYDGKQGGTETSFQVSSVKREGELADASRNHPLYMFLEAKNAYKGREITGIEKVEGEEAFVLALKPDKGTAVRHYVSKTSFRLLKSVQGDVTTTFHDYRKEGDMLFPFRAVYSSSGLGRNVLTVKKVIVNAQLPEKTFQPIPKTEPTTP
jgi:CubicO group peptidase (beta-lactamase class C family)